MSSPSTSEKPIESSSPQTLTDTLPDLARSGPKTWKAGTLVYTFGGLVALFIWLLFGDFAWAMRERTVGSIAQWALKKYHASDTLISLFLTVAPPAIGIFLVPYISYKSDRHRGRWGRRVPFLLIPTPIITLAMLGLAFTPTMGTWLHEALGKSSPGENACVLIFFGCFWIVYDFALIIAQAVFSAFVNDVVPRELLGRFFGLFRVVSLGVGIAFQGQFFGKVSAYYTPIFITIALIYGVGLSLTCFFVKEGEYPPPPPVDLSQTDSRLATTKMYLRECFSSSYYRWVFVVMLLSTLAFLPINTFNYNYAKSLNMTDVTYGKLMALYFSMSLVLSLPIGWLVDKFHSLRVGMAALILHGIASLWGGLFIHDATTFGIANVLTGLLSGVWFTATASLTMALFPKMKFAQYSSAVHIINSLAIMTLGFVQGPVLDYFGHPYYLTYLVGFLFDGLGLVACIVVWRKFMALGGPKGYVAPEVAGNHPDSPVTLNK